MHPEVDQPVPGYDRVLAASLPEWEAKQHRRRSGIVLYPSVINMLRSYAERDGLEFDLFA